MNPLTKLLEAAFFCSARPLSLAELRALDSSADKAAVLEALDELRRTYDEGEHGVELVELAEGYQVLTRPEVAETLTRARIAQRPRKLSAAALETLAIIAYRQPVGRAEIEEVRGVAADGVLRALQERGLVDAVGRGEGLGRPLLYGTTPRFLEMLGLRGLSQLPRREELAVALRPIVETLPDRGLTQEAMEVSLEESPPEGGEEARGEDAVTEAGSGREAPAGSHTGGDRSADQVSSG